MFGNATFPFNKFRLNSTEKAESRENTGVQEIKKKISKSQKNERLKETSLRNVLNCDPNDKQSSHCWK
jgi:hypothetical protein